MAEPGESDRKKNGEFTTTHTSKSLDSDVDSYLYNVFHPQSKANYGGTNDPQLTELLLAQRREAALVAGGGGARGLGLVAILHPVDGVLLGPQQIEHGLADHHVVFEQLTNGRPSFEPLAVINDDGVGLEGRQHAVDIGPDLDFFCADSSTDDGRCIV